MYRGSCLCTKINYTIEGELSDFGYCHCVDCQKASGSAHGANAGIEREKLTLNDPLGFLKEYQSSSGKFRAFCSNCGTPLFAYLSQSYGVIRIRLGTLDTPFHKQAQAHTFVDSKATWEVIEGKVPQFKQWAPQDVLIQKGSRQP